MRTLASMDCWGPPYPENPVPSLMIGLGNPSRTVRLRVPPFLPEGLRAMKALARRGRTQVSRGRSLRPFQKSE